MILFNKAAETYFVYNPNKNRFLHENYRTAFWAKNALGWGTLECNDIEQVNKFRNLLESYDFKGKSTNEILTFIQNNHPSWFI